MGNTFSKKPAGRKINKYFSGKTESPNRDVGAKKQTMTPAKGKRFKAS